MQVERSFIFDPSLVLYLPLYELDGASFMSKDKHGHLCTVTGALWTPQGGSFDGVDDYIVIPTNPVFYFPGNFTLEVWLYLNQLPPTYYVWKSSSTVGALAGAVANDHFSIGRSLIDEQIIVYYTPPVSSWFHLLITKSGATGRFYLNGNLIGSGDSDMTYPQGNVILGIDGDYSSLPFNGIMGEVRIYNRALTPAECQNIYLTTKWRYR